MSAPVLIPSTFEKLVLGQLRKPENRHGTTAGDIRKALYVDRPTVADVERALTGLASAGLAINFAQGRRMNLWRAADDSPIRDALIALAEAEANVRQQRITLETCETAAAERRLTVLKLLADAQASHERSTQLVAHRGIG